MKLALMLRNLGFSAIPLNGQMSQNKRLGALNKFKAKNRSVLIATDVASRGLDIPHVDIVVNFDIPTNSKDYIHRVGRTARAGRAGKSVTFVTQYDVELYQKIETAIGKKLEEWPHEKDEVLALKEHSRPSASWRSARLSSARSSPRRPRCRLRDVATVQATARVECSQLHWWLDCARRACVARVGVLLLHSPPLACAAA